MYISQEYGGLIPVFKECFDNNVETLFLCITVLWMVSDKAPGYNDNDMSALSSMASTTAGIKEKIAKYPS